MANITLVPTTVAPGDRVDVIGAGFKKNRFNLTTVNSAGVEVGQTTTTSRPKRDGSFQVGINAPTLEGASFVRAYQLGVKVAEAALLVKIPVTPPPATVPGAPTLSATAGDTVALLSWTTPADGGSPITGYKVYIAGVLKATPTTSPFNQTGLTNGQTYSFTLSAFNAVGEGPKSNAVAVTPFAVITPPPGDPAFLARPASGAISKDGGSSVLIENVAIHLGSLNSPSGIGITIKNINGTITLRNIDFADLVGGLYMYNCTGTLIIENIRSRNIGDGSIGSGHSNHFQLAECSVAGHISGWKALGGHSEDMFSTWHSGGKGVGQELVIENNHLQGLVTDTATARAWTSGSGTGTILSDGAGSPKNGYIIVRNNTYLTPGQVGIQHIDGPGLQTYNNIILEEKRSQNNNAMTSWEGNPRGVVHDNRYYVTKDDGTHPAIWFSAFGSMVLTNNIMDSTISAASLQVVL